MKNTVILILGFLILISCNQSSNKKTVSAIKQTECKPYFEFDEIEHYSTEIDESQLYEIETKKIKTEEEKKQADVIGGDMLSQLSDTIIIKDLGKLGFTKNIISKGQFKVMNEVFCERKHETSEDYSCLEVYRDIFVFKRNNKIIGTAKICFSCHQRVIAGTKSNTREFGQSGDYEKLSKALNLIRE